MSTNQRVITTQRTPAPVDIVDQKRGSAITFFDESEGENDQQKYDEMNATLDGFKRPVKQGEIDISGSQQ